MRIEYDVCYHNQTTFAGIPVFGRCVSILLTVRAGHNEPIKFKISENQNWSLISPNGFFFFFTNQVPKITVSPLRGTSTDGNGDEWTPSLGMKDELLIINDLEG